MKAKSEIQDINLETDRLYLKKPTMEEQFALWNILRQRCVYRYYMPIPKIFNADREAFERILNNWTILKKCCQLKISQLEKEADKYIWSIFLKSGEVIGQITIQKSKKNDDLTTRNIAWYISPEYQKMGYATEAAKKIIEFMFEQVEINKIETEADIVNNGSWKLMEKLGFQKTDESFGNRLDDNGNCLKKYDYVLTKERYFANKKG